MYALLNLSTSPFENFLVSTTTPPLAPPKGMLTTAHFNVIRKASVFTSSKSTSWWNLMPPLVGPLALLNCILYPVNIFVLPSSIITGKLKVKLLLGVVRISISDSVNFNFELNSNLLATLLSILWQFTQTLIFSICKALLACYRKNLFSKGFLYSFLVKPHYYLSINIYYRYSHLARFIYHFLSCFLVRPNINVHEFYIF